MLYHNSLSLICYAVSNFSSSSSVTTLRSPSEDPTIVATVASPVTLTTVRHISNILSIGKIIAIQAGFKPTDPNTIINITKPALGTAADPIEASVAVRIIVSCAPKSKSIP